MKNVPLQNVPLLPGWPLKGLWFAVKTRESRDHCTTVQCTTVQCSTAQCSAVLTDTCGAAVNRYDTDILNTFYLIASHYVVHTVLCRWLGCTVDWTEPPYV